MRILNKSNWMALVLMHAMLLASLPRPAFAATPVATSFNVTASTVGNKAITLQGSDADGTALTFALLSQPTHGAISGFSASTGALIYTPAFGYSGADSFTFKVTSGGQDSNIATVSITVATDKTRIIDYVTDAGGVGQVGKVTFVLTSASSTGGGLISPASSVTANTDATGKYDLSVIASVNLSPKSYYQVYFQANYSDRRLLGIYDIPVSVTPIVLQPYRVTDTNLAARYTFADKASVDSLQTANANAVFQSLLPAGIEDGRVIGFDSGTGRMKASAIRETASKIELSKPVGAISADSIATPSVNAATGNFSGNVTVQSITGNGSGLTGVVGTGAGGTDSEGSVSIIANKNGATPGAVIEGLVGPTGNRVSVYRSDANGFDMLKGLPRSTRAGLPAVGNAGRLYKLTDSNLGLVYDNGTDWVDTNGGIFNLRDFGAKGTGSINDSTAYALALTALNAAGGGRLYFPKGRYPLRRGTGALLSDNITTSNVVISGDGEGTVLVLEKTGVLSNDSGNEFYNCFQATGRSNITIENLRFEGYGTLLYTDSCTNVKLDKVTGSGLLANAGGYLYNKAVYFHKTIDVKVDKCNFYNYEFGVYLSGTNASRTKSVKITNSIFEHSVAAGSFTALFPVGVYPYYADDVLVQGCTFKNIYSSVDNGNTGSGLGYGVYEGDGASNSVTVDNCDFIYEGNGNKNANAIYVNEAISATITSNRISSDSDGRLTAGILIDAKTTGAIRIINSNKITNAQSGLSSFGVYFTGASSTNTLEASAANNTIIGFTNGIRVDGLEAGSYNFTTNTLKNQLGSGIQFTGINASIKFPKLLGNTITGSQANGILFNQYIISPQVIGNTILDGNLANTAAEAGAAVYFVSASSGSYIANNIIGNTPGGSGKFTYGVANVTNHYDRIFKDIVSNNAFQGFGTNFRYAAFPNTEPRSIYDVQRGEFIENTTRGDGSYEGWYCVQAFNLTLSADASNASTTITVASTGSLQAGDIVQFLKDSNPYDADYRTTANWHVTTIASVTNGTQFVITDAIPGGDGTYVAGTAVVRTARMKAGRIL